MSERSTPYAAAFETAAHHLYLLAIGISKDEPLIPTSHIWPLSRVLDESSEKTIGRGSLGVDPPHGAAARTAMRSLLAFIDILLNPPEYLIED